MKINNQTTKNIHFDLILVESRSSLMFMQSAVVHNSGAHTI